ncbi:MAG: hypothetical protein MRECE_59c001 [Mycoplasmataceae bacterium CE_OT135]|nr:MAG: hypothetical protein MRECE_59c001 [Mycoplasmataceae bacterium CE_OT135]
MTWYLLSIYNQFKLTKWLNRDKSERLLSLISKQNNFSAEEGRIKSDRLLSLHSSHFNCWQLVKFKEVNWLREQYNFSKLTKSVKSKLPARLLKLINNSVIASLFSLG